MTGERESARTAAHGRLSAFFRRRFSFKAVSVRDRCKEKRFRERVLRSGAAAQNAETRLHDLGNSRRKSAEKGRSERPVWIITPTACLQKFLPKCKNFCSPPPDAAGGRRAVRKGAPADRAAAHFSQRRVPFAGYEVFGGVAGDLTAKITGAAAQRPVKKLQDRAADLHVGGLKIHKRR